jgi:hypothetical protein
LFIWRGEAEHDALVEAFNNPHRAIHVVLTARGVPEEQAKWQTMPIAFTVVKPNWETACLPSVPIVLVWPASGLSTQDWNQVVLHELLHSLGATHTPDGVPFSTVMHPGLATEHRVGLSQADKTWLRAVYGQ